MNDPLIIRVKVPLPEHTTVDAAVLDTMVGQTAPVTLSEDRREAVGRAFVLATGEGDDGPWLDVQIDAPGEDRDVCVRLHVPAGRRRQVNVDCTGGCGTTFTGVPDGVIGEGQVPWCLDCLPPRPPAKPKRRRRRGLFRGNRKAAPDPDPVVGRVTAVTSTGATVKLTGGRTA